MKKVLVLFLLFIVASGCVKKKDYLLFQNDQQARNEQQAVTPRKEKRSSADGFKHFFFGKDKAAAAAVEKKKEIQPSQPEEMQAPFVMEYKIANKDKLSILVYNQMIPIFPYPAVNNNQTNQPNEMVISNDGTVVLPLIGKVKLGGLTEDAAAAKLTDEFKKYYRHPFVKLEILNKRVYVIGEVRKPGPVPVVNDRITVIEAIAQAGDLNEYCDRTSILVIRGSNHLSPQISKIDLTKIASLSTRSLMLYPGDVVYAQPNRMRSVNVNVKEYLPTLQVISAALNPFVSLKYLKD